MDFRDQVGGRDVDEVAGGDAEQGQLDARDVLRDEDGQDGRDRADQRAEDVPDDNALAGHAGVDHDREVADFARDLVEEDGHGGGDADGRVDEEGGGDDRAVDEVVDRVADDVERDEVGVVVVGFIFVAVVVLENDFLDDEEEQETEHRPTEDSAYFVGMIGDRFGQKVEEGRTHQGTGGEADEVAGQFLDAFEVRKHQKTSDQAEEAGEGCGEYSVH